MSKKNNLKNKCRTCFNGSKGFQLLTKMITEKKEETKSYGEFLKDLTNIDMMGQTSNKIPQTICGCCIRKIKATYGFVRQAQEVNNRLWSVLNEVKNENVEKPTDCLQEAQIDIQNCLEIVMDDEVGGINRKELAAIKTELKLEEPEVLNVISTMSIDKSGINAGRNDIKEINARESIYPKQIESISECEDDYDADDIFDKDFPKPNERLSDSDGDSMSSNDSDWAKETNIAKAKENKVKSKTTVRAKKVKEKDIDDNIPTPCDQCDRVFPNSRLLSRHKRHTHVPDELKVQCPYCPARFGRRHNMYAHMRTHHKDKPIEEHITQQRKFPRQYACEQCDGTYTSKYYLLAHMKIKHNPDSTPKKPERVILPKKRFLCTLCGSKFDTQSNLDVHIRRHTGEKPYNCDLCDRSFYRPCDVQAHRRSHTGEKPFICKICDKAFARSNKLKIHMRTHSNERPYKCKQCEKAFKHSKDLNIHKRIHTGERPYTCGVCHSTFTQSNSLKLHQTKQQHFETMDQIVSC